MRKKISIISIVILLSCFFLLSAVKGEYLPIYWVNGEATKSQEVPAEVSLEDKTVRLYPENWVLGTQNNFVGDIIGLNGNSKSAGKYLLSISEWWYKFAPENKNFEPPPNPSTFEIFLHPFEANGKWYEAKPVKVNFSPAEALTPAPQIILLNAAPPFISAWEPNADTKVFPAFGKEIKVTYGDDGSGVDPKNVKFYLNQKEIAENLTITGNSLSYLPKEASPLPFGENKVKIEITDFAGLTTAQEWVFSVNTMPKKTLFEITLYLEGYYNFSAKSQVPIKLQAEARKVPAGANQDIAWNATEMAPQGLCTVELDNMGFGSGAFDGLADGEYFLVFKPLIEGGAAGTPFLPIITEDKITLMQGGLTRINLSNPQALDDNGKNIFKNAYKPDNEILTSLGAGNIVPLAPLETYQLQMAGDQAPQPYYFMRIGDIDGNGMVESLDFTYWEPKWIAGANLKNGDAEYAPLYDLDQNGVIEGLDFSNWENSWNKLQPQTAIKHTYIKDYYNK